MLTHTPSVRLRYSRDETTTCAAPPGPDHEAVRDVRGSETEQAAVRVRAGGDVDREFDCTQFHREMFIGGSGRPDGLDPR